MRLHFKAVSKDGKVSRGIVEAKDIGEAASYLRSKDMIPIQITKEQKKAFELPFLNRISSNDLILFTRQLSSMLASGLTVMKALQILKNQTQNEAMLEVLNGIITDVEEGKNLASAIAKYPKVFSPIYISIIKAGESAGLLDKVLLRLADNLEKQQKLKGTIKGALMYPAIVIILMIGVVGIMMIFVIPQLTSLYGNMGVTLPITTRVVIGLSNFTSSFWPIILIVAFVTGAFYKRWSKTPDGRFILDNLSLKLPIFGKLIRESILAEFSRTLGLLIGTGSLVVDSLLETADTTGNVHYKNAIIDVSHKVEKGVSIGDAMSFHPLFPPLLVQLVKIGEETGKIDESMEKASEFFEREVDETVKTLTTAMEPFIMIVLGVGVAFLILAVITPIYSLISNIQ
jgi:type IV pilus assembly protein PilC